MNVYMSPDTFGQMMVQAVRYALGRRTTAPGDTKGAVVCAWDALPQHWRGIIDRDVREAIEQAERLGETVGDQCDHDTWIELRDWLDEMHAIEVRHASAR